MTIAPLSADHADRVLAIYRAGIDEGSATFETTAPARSAFDATKLREHRFVALDEGGAVLGRVATARASDRCAHAGVVEHSVRERRGLR